MLLAPVNGPFGDFGWVTGFADLCISAPRTGSWALRPSPRLASQDASHAEPLPEPDGRSRLASPVTATLRPRTHRRRRLFPACGVRRATAWTDVPPDARRRPWCGQRPHRGHPILLVQFPRVPAPMPRSRATQRWACRSPKTVVTAPSGNSASYFLRSGMASPRRRCLHGKGSAQPPSAERHATKSANAAVSPSIVSTEPRRCPCECRRAQRTPRRRLAATFRWAVALSRTRNRMLWEAIR